MTQTHSLLATAAAALLSTGVAAARNLHLLKVPLRKDIKNVLLVHGAFADGSSWAKVIPPLQAKGYHVVAVQIPLTLSRR